MAVLCGGMVGGEGGARESGRGERGGGKREKREEKEGLVNAERGREIDRKKLTSNVSSIQREEGRRKEEGGKRT